MGCSSYHISVLTLSVEQLLKPCICGQVGLWSRLADATLNANGIELQDFWSSMAVLLERGRGKGRNLFLVGPSNCGKSFLARPLELIFRSLVNPAANNFAFAGIEGKELVVLDDFRFTGKAISWSDLLLLLDGATVNFSLPRTHFVRDVCVLSTNTIPVICTGKSVPVFVERGKENDVESEMLRFRFKVYPFSKQIQPSFVQECPPCPRCFVDCLKQHSNILP